MKIIGARHAQSAHNAGLVTWAQTPGGNSQIPLTELGHGQSRQLGVELGPDFLRQAQHHVSPFLRARLTHQGVLHGAGLDNGFDPIVDSRLAEMDFGGEEWTLALRDEPGGIFNHVFASGKSFSKDGIADMCSFVADLRRTILAAPQDQFIVCHGWTCLLLVVAWFDLGNDAFNTLENMGYCECLTIAPLPDLKGEPVFVANGWGVTGIRFRD